MTYLIGRAESPEIDDPRFDTESEALIAARHAATGDRVYAVWEQIGEDDFNTLYLIYQEEVWKRH